MRYKLFSHLILSAYLSEEGTDGNRHILNLQFLILN